MAQQNCGATQTLRINNQFRNLSYSIKPHSFQIDKLIYSPFLQVLSFHGKKY